MACNILAMGTAGAAGDGGRRRVIDRYASRLARLSTAVMSGPGRTDSALRRAAADGGDVPAHLANYVEKVRHAAYRVTDEDVRALVAAGLSEDVIFEVTISAAFGAALRRLDAGLAALRQAPE